MNTEIQAGSDAAEQRRVVCSAVLFEDNTVILGARHWDGHMRVQVQRLSLSAKRCMRKEVSQGFVDQHGTYMDRKEALKVALAAGQRAYRCGGDEHQLYSENLY